VDELSPDQAALQRAVARRFADAWEPYWTTRGLPWEGTVEEFPTIGERGLELMRFGIASFDACDEDDFMMLQALAMFMHLADDLVLIDAATVSESAFAALPLAARIGFETLLSRSGIADWCARLDAPLTDRDGDAIASENGPQRGPFDISEGLVLVLEFGAPGAELAAPDARRDLAAALSDAVTSYRRILATVSEDASFSENKREVAVSDGIAALRKARLAAPAALRDVALGHGADDPLANEIGWQISFVSLVSRCLILIGDANRAEDRLAAALFDADDLDQIENYSPDA
jgi:hypothetical protein